MTTRREYRYDRGPLLRSYVRETDGAVLAEGIAARECVLIYRRADGTTIRELVTADAIRSGANLLSRAPVTLGHPPENVTPQNARKYVVGDVDGEVQLENGGFTRVRVAVRDADAIEALRSGTVEISMGYACDIDPRGGVHPEFGAYDARQVHRDTNHLAIVDTARAGHEVRLRVDAAETVDLLRADAAPPPAGTPASRKLMNPRFASLLAAYGVFTSYQTDDAAFDALTDAQQRRADAATEAGRLKDGQLTAATTARDTEKARADAADAAIGAAKAEAAAAKVRADTAEAELTKLRADAKTRADAETRTGLEPLCRRFRVDAKDHPELPKLKRALATAHHGGELPAHWTEAHVDAALELAAKDHADGVATGKRLFAPPGGGGANPARHDGTRPAGRPSAYSRALARSDSARKSGGEA